MKYCTKKVQIWFKNVASFSETLSTLLTGSMFVTPICNISNTGGHRRGTDTLADTRTIGVLEHST